MLKEERYRRIVRALSENGSARVHELAAMLNTSRVTIWRDIDTLAEQGKVTKVYGGATLNDSQRNELQPAPHQRGSTRSIEGAVIGIQVPELLYYFQPIIAGARAACEQAGARLSVTVAGEAAETYDDALESLLELNVDGLLLTPPLRPGQTGPIFERLAQLEVPHVLVEREDPGLQFHQLRSVSTAHEAGVYAAVGHLKDLGHREVGLLIMSDQGDPMRRVVQGWRTACRALEIGGKEPPEWIMKDPSPEILDAVLESGVTGLLSMNDVITAKFLRHARRRGTRIPEDLSLISYDDELAGNLTPPVTAVSPSRDTVGFVAAQELLGIVAGADPGPGRRLLINPELVIRNSTAGCPQ